MHKPCMSHSNDSIATAEYKPAVLYSNVTWEHGGHQVYTTLRSKTVKSLFGDHNLKAKVHSLYV